MLFRLKSAGATYKRGIQWCLHSHLGCNSEGEDEGVISDLAKTFDNMRKFKMKLNPKKCTFGVPSEKLLKYMVSRCSIDPNLEKVSIITKMKLPKSLHDVYKLTRCMIALNKFISLLGVRGTPFL
jgi:hypothetical protein